MSYEFTEDWLFKHVKVWKEIFATFLPNATSLLEVGSYEGRSACWLIENALPNGGEIHCIDTWEGGIEHDKKIMPEVEARFDRNTDIALQTRPDIQLHKIKQRSHLALAQKLIHYEAFDFIYLDASHQCADVLTDLVLCFHLLKPEGVIICDDYLFNWNVTGNPMLLPKMAIDAAVNCFHGKIYPLLYAPLYQIYLRKKA